jgi:hypothetical protein
MTFPQVRRCFREESARKPDPVPAAGCPAAGGDHLSGTSVTRRLARPTRDHVDGPPWSLLGLAPGGACPATTVTRRAGELLPHRFTLTRVAPGGLLSVALATCHHAWELPSTLPCGVRTFLTSGHPIRATSGAAAWPAPPDHTRVRDTSR